MEKRNITEEQAIEEIGLIRKLHQEKPEYGALTQREKEVCRELYQAVILIKEALPKGFPRNMTGENQRERRRNVIRTRLRRLWSYTWFRVFSDVALSLCMLAVIAVIILLCVLIARQ